MNEIDNVTPLFKNRGQVVPFERVERVEPCHDHSGFETDGLPPQERTVLSMGRRLFRHAIRESGRPVGIVPNVSVDDGQWAGYEVTQGISRPRLTLVSED